MRHALAKFRLGNAGLGNREGTRVSICPACNNRVNNESHLFFQCTAPEIKKVKDEPGTRDLLQNFYERYPNVNNQDEALKNFLRGGIKELQRRGNLLAKILKSFKEHYQKGSLDDQEDAETERKKRQT